MKTITEMATELQSTNNHYHIYVTCEILYNSIDHIARWLPCHTNAKSPEYSLAIIAYSNYRDFPNLSAYHGQQKNQAN